MKTYFIIELANLNSAKPAPDFLVPFKIYHQYTTSIQSAKQLFSFLINYCSVFFSGDKFLDINEFKTDDEHILFSYDNGLRTFIRLYAIKTEHKTLYIFNNIEQFGNEYNRDFVFHSANFFFNLKDVKKEMLKYATIYYQRQEEILKKNDNSFLSIPCIYSSPKTLAVKREIKGHGLNVSYDIKDLRYVHENIKKPYR